MGNIIYVYGKINDLIPTQKDWDDVLNPNQNLWKIGEKFGLIRADIIIIHEVIVNTILEAKENEYTSTILNKVIEKLLIRDVRYSHFACFLLGAELFKYFAHKTVHQTFN